MPERDVLGKFQPGNQAANKSRICPHCGKSLMVSVYVYLKAENGITPLKNGEKQTDII